MPPEPIDRFETLFQEWASRPPKTPADQAARQVLRRLPTASTPSTAPAQPSIFSWLQITATVAAALALVLVTQFFLLGPSVSPVTHNTAINLVEAPLVPDGVVLIMLDSGTPLYLTLNTPVTPEGDPTS